MATALALLAGLVLAILIALGRELLRRNRALEDDDGREYQLLRREAFADLRHPLRGLARAARARRLP
jgi:hypothetical protein